MACEHVVGIYINNVPMTINTVFGNVEFEFPEVDFFTKVNEIPKNSTSFKFLYCPICGAEINWKKMRE